MTSFHWFSMEIYRKPVKSPDPFDATDYCVPAVPEQCIHITLKHNVAWASQMKEAQLFIFSIWKKNMKVNANLRHIASHCSGLICP